MRHKGDKLTLRLVGRVNLGIQLGVGNCNRGMVSKTAQEVQFILLEAVSGQAFEQEKTDNAHFAANGDNQLAARPRKESAHSGDIFHDNAARLTAGNGLAERRMVKRDERFGVRGHLFIVAIVSHNFNAALLHKTNKPGIGL